MSIFLISVLNFSISTAHSFPPSRSLPLLCVFWGGWMWEGVLGVCFILLGTTPLPDNSLKTGKNAT